MIPLPLDTQIDDFIEFEKKIRDVSVKNHLRLDLSTTKFFRPIDWKYYYLGWENDKIYEFTRLRHSFFTFIPKIIGRFDKKEPESISYRISVVTSFVWIAILLLVLTDAFQYFSGATDYQSLEALIPFFILYNLLIVMEMFLLKKSVSNLSDRPKETI